MTQLSAQTGNKICYTTAELEKIANKMVEANTNAKLLKIAEQQLAESEIALAAKDSALAAQELVIVSKESVIVLKEEIIAGKDREITDLRVALTKTNRKLKWTKLKWAGTTVGLSGALIYVILK